MIKSFSIQSHAKVNIFLKVIGQRGNYHELLSRFVKVPHLYDTLTFKPNNSTNRFNLIGDFDCSQEENTIYKAFLVLRNNCPKIDAYFRVYSIYVDKTIPTGSGLGGGSSNAAAFLLLVNRVFDLNYSVEKLCRMGLKVGADVPFFIHQCNSANVRGIGEHIEVFEENPLKFRIITPAITCHTKKVFQYFSHHYYQTPNSKEKAQWEELFALSTPTLLEQLIPRDANDLYQSAISCYEPLLPYAKEDWFLSGSGSSFFQLEST